LLQKYNGKNIDICSDSQAALKAISSVQFEFNSVLECRKLLMELAETNKVCLIWVPGHSDIKGNEMADELARQGSDSSFVGPEPALPITLSWVKSEIDKEARVLHTRYWKNKPGHQHSKLFLREPLGVASRKILNMSKKRLRLLVGTVSRHFTCNNHLSISDFPRAVFVTDVDPWI
jgi:hypothetical protein